MTITDPVVVKSEESKPSDKWEKKGADSFTNLFKKIRKFLIYVNSIYTALSLLILAFQRYIIHGIPSHDNAFLVRNSPVWRIQEGMGSPD